MSASIEDPTLYDIPNRRPANHSDLLHFNAMSQQVATLNSLLNMESPWDQVRRSYHLVGKLERLDFAGLPTQFLSLYRRHVDEWRDVEVNLIGGLIEDQPQTAKILSNSE